MKIKLTLFVLGLVFINQIQASPESFFEIDVSQENRFGITAEKLKDGDYLIKLPRTYNDVSLSGTGLIIGDEEVDPDSHLYVALKPYDNGEMFELNLAIGNHFIDSVKINVLYSRPNISCLEGVFILSGLDKLKHSPHWREIDKKLLFKRSKQLKRGMSLSEVWKILGHPYFESSPYPRSVDESVEGYVLKYVILKGEADDRSKDQILNINFNKGIKFTDVSFVNLDKDL